MKILFQLPKCLSFADIPPKFSVDVAFCHKGNYYVVEEDTKKDIGVIVDSAVDSIEKFYIVRKIDESQIE
ncbi:hypothetical protein NEOKW01_1714 [Nematocida sp. AWRm80]|nr:hypothetical protein NEOKW01_1714 [Nematocida sp. AWRm80]